MLVVAAAEPTRTSGVVVSTAEPHVCAPIDVNGNVTSDGTKSYHWNALNQLVEVKEGTTPIATFEYDGAGRRTEKVAAGVTHTYVYDAEDIVEERITGSSSDTIRYYHGGGIDEPLARTNGSSVTTYYLADHLGSIVQETNASGAVTLEREYGPWGDLLSGTSTAGYAFQGREWDAEIGLYYFRARYYNAAAGAWASDDPIGFAAGPNFSQFVGNNPVRFVDPFGLCSEENDQDQQLEFKPGTTEEEKRLIRKSVEETGHYVEMILMVASLGEGGLTKVPGEVAKNLSRFTKSLPKAASEVRVAMSGENYLFTADVPGKVPGWSAVYQKLVNAAGETIGMIKTTLNPQGLIEHIKQKFP